MTDFLESICRDCIHAEVCFMRSKLWDKERKIQLGKGVEARVYYVIRKCGYLKKVKEAKE